MIEPYYNEDGVRIFCGDCREVVPELGLPSIGLAKDGRFDLLLTDPPYGLNLGNDLWTYQRGKIKQSDWDLDRPSQDTIGLIRRFCDKQIIWGGNYFCLPPSRCWLSWIKPDAPPSMGNVEYAWTNLDQNSRFISQSISATNGERIGHPTQKPLRLMVWCLQKAGEGVRTVLDPFMGSGTTLVAAKLRGLQAVGIELNKDYCDMAVERLRQRILIPA